MREDQVQVKAKDGAGAVTYGSHAHRLSLQPGEAADKWANGDPITRGEFEALLKPHNFEVLAAPAQEEK